jgi:hypothetical protein
MYKFCTDLRTKQRLFTYAELIDWLLGAFEKLRKATISLVMSVRSSGRPSAWNSSAPTGLISHEIWYLSIFQKPVEKSQVSLKSVESNGYSA